MKNINIRAIINTTKIITITLTMLLGYLLVTYNETHYNRQGVVIAIEDDIIIVEDTTGNVWEYETNDYNVGDNVTLKMFNSYTDSNIYDDIIEKVL